MPVRIRNPEVDRLQQSLSSAAKTPGCLFCSVLTLAGGGLHVAVTRKINALITLVTVALGLASARSTPVLLPQLPQSHSSAQAQHLLPKPSPSSSLKQSKLFRFKSRNCLLDCLPFPSVSVSTPDRSLYDEPGPRLCSDHLGQITSYPRNTGFGADLRPWRIRE